MTLAVVDQPALGMELDAADAHGRALALALFATLKARGYFAYREDAPGGGGTVLTSLDGVEADATVVFLPAMVGG